MKGVLDPWLLSILVCPVTRTGLRYDEDAQELISDAAGLAYPIRDGVPVMLAEEAAAVGRSGMKKKTKGRASGAAMMVWLFFANLFEPRKVAAIEHLQKHDQIGSDGERGAATGPGGKTPLGRPRPAGIRATLHPRP